MHPADQTQMKVERLRVLLQEKETEMRELKKRRPDSLHFKVQTYNGDSDFYRYLDQLMAIVEF